MTTILVFGDGLWTPKTPSPLSNSDLWQLPQDMATVIYTLRQHTPQTLQTCLKKPPQGYYFSVLWNVNRENINNAFAELYASCLKNNMQYTRYYMFHHSPTSESTEFAIKWLMSCILLQLSAYITWCPWTTCWHTFWCIARKTKRQKCNGKNVT